MNGMVVNSTLHTHSDACLSPVAEVPVGLGEINRDPKTGELKTQMKTVGPGWFRCSAFSAYWLHDHGARLVSHFPGETVFARCSAA